MRDRCALLAVLAILICSCGCNPEDTSNLQRDTSQLAKTTAESLANAALAARVNSVLAVWKGIDMSGFRVEARNGAVTLNGQVRTEKERTEILRVVNQIRGVNRVVDRLQVRATSQNTGMAHTRQQKVR
ncbi:MAG: BON domain-containing protein [Chloroherpetonaceae bacterium]|nr:BON domain-containing protein [Chthonomonadaceae bacterium]MDW8207275.1 BON domain-containing protein [Chloroherpetonaceae bacterium]